MPASCFLLLLLLSLTIPATGAETYPHYYAHPAVADAHGVIAPWYRRQNGQFDYRVRIAMETLKRYPQMTLDGTPEWVVSGFVNQLRTLPVRLGPLAPAA